MRSALQRHLVLLFVAVTYAWTWGVGVPGALAAHGIAHVRISQGAFTLAGFAPTFAAFILLAASGGRPALREIWHRTVYAGAAPAWYAGVIFAPIASVALALAILPNARAYLATLDAWYTPLATMLFLVPLTGFFEEIGWRGLMQDRLQARMSPATAGLLVALAWGPWHIPTYLRTMPEGDRTPLLIVWFLVGIVPLSLLFAWVYVRTGRRLLPVIVLHASVDASIGYFFARLPAGELRPFIAWSSLLWIAAATVLWKEGPGLGRRADGIFAAS